MCVLKQPEDNLWESDLFTVWILGLNQRVYSLGGDCLYCLCHLTKPRVFFIHYVKPIPIKETALNLERL